MKKVRCLRKLSSIKIDDSFILELSGTDYETTGVKMVPDHIADKLVAAGGFELVDVSTASEIKKNILKSKWMDKLKNSVQKCLQTLKRT